MESLGEMSQKKMGQIPQELGGCKHVMENIYTLHNNLGGYNFGGL